MEVFESGLERVRGSEANVYEFARRCQTASREGSWTDRKETHSDGQAAQYRQWA